VESSKARDLCVKLIRADSEDEVIRILESAGLWDDKTLWRYYGDKENTFGIIGNQASSADAALVEKLVNSIDARLTNECLLRSIDAEGPEAPQTMREAVAKFFDEGNKSSTAGLITEWPDSKRRELAKGITLAATGTGPSEGNPCITICDQGEGQAPADFPETFVSLTQSNKLRVPFVQGKFNQGGTGALQFCGRHNFQLIVSRRNPQLLRKPSKPSDSEWGFTIVRREDPELRRRNSTFTYLAPTGASDNPRKGEVLHFAEEVLRLLPDGKNPYATAAKFGTLIKLYEYNLAGFRGHILRKGGLLARLDLLLPNPALPMRLHECRPSYRGHEGSYDTTLTGVQTRLDNDRKENIEDGFPTTSTLKVSGEQLTTKVYAFKKGKAETYRRSEGVIFVLNGQTHGSLSADFFRRDKVGLSYLSDSLLVLVDCSNFRTRNREDLFMTSRERMRRGEFREELETSLEEMLRYNQLLRDLRERRRREMTEARLDDSKPLEEVLQLIIKKHPTLAALFLEGKRLPSPFKTTGVGPTDQEFKGKTYPTFFKFKSKEYGTDLQRECHINMRARIAFETDASNDYFDRKIDAGTCAVYLLMDNKRLEADDYLMNLQNGIATLNLTLPSGAKVGEVVHGVCVVNDSSRVDPFENSFHISIRKEAAPTGVPHRRRQPPGPKPGPERETPAGMDLPNITDVHEADWDRHTPPFDKHTALSIKSIGLEDTSDGDSSKEVFDFYVNVDNLYLKTELKSGSGKLDPEITKARFRYGLVLIGLGLLQQELTSGKKKPDGSADDSREEEETCRAQSVEDRVASTTAAIAPILLPMISSLGALELDDVGSGEFTAESN
jgi:hypothetical protein